MQRSTLAVLALLLFVSCFERPIREDVVVTFSEDGSAIVKLDVSFMEDTNKQAVRDRLSTLRREYIDQHDPWTRRFQRVRAKEERYATESTQGELLRVERMAKVNPDLIGEFFYDTSITISYLERDDVAELSVYAGASQRASRDQVDEYKRVMETWSRDLLEYFRAMRRVYRYLDNHPERAEIVFLTIFDEEVEGYEDDLTDEEISLLERVDGAMDRVTSVISIQDERDHSLDEISELVNDPFPASLTVVPGGSIIELEGFIRIPETTRVRVPRANLWSALESLSDRWLSPDPLVVMFSTLENESSEEPKGLTLARLPRRATTPDDWHEIEEALELTMRVPDTLRVSWGKE